MKWSWQLDSQSSFFPPSKPGVIWGHTNVHTRSEHYTSAQGFRLSGLWCRGGRAGQRWGQARDQHGWGKAGWHGAVEPGKGVGRPWLGWWGPSWPDDALRATVWLCPKPPVHTHPAGPHSMFQHRCGPLGECGQHIQLTLTILLSFGFKIFFYYYYFFVKPLNFSSVSEGTPPVPTGEVDQYSASAGHFTNTHFILCIAFMIQNFLFHFPWECEAFQGLICLHYRTI